MIITFYQASEDGERQAGTLNGWRMLGKQASAAVIFIACVYSLSDILYHRATG